MISLCYDAMASNPMLSYGQVDDDIFNSFVYVAIPLRSLIYSCRNYGHLHILSIKKFNLFM